MLSKIENFITCNENNVKKDIEYFEFDEAKLIDNLETHLQRIPFEQILSFSNKNIPKHNLRSKSVIRRLDRSQMRKRSGKQSNIDMPIVRAKSVIRGKGRMKININEHASELSDNDYPFSPNSKKSLILSKNDNLSEFGDMSRKDDNMSVLSLRSDVSRQNQEITLLNREIKLMKKKLNQQLKINKFQVKRYENKIN